MQLHCDATRRAVHVVNLDPAAEHFKYSPSIGMSVSLIFFHRLIIISDIRELIEIEDVVDELKYGPNGGLIFCME